LPYNCPKNPWNGHNKDFKAFIYYDKVPNFESHAKDVQWSFFNAMHSIDSGTNAMMNFPIKSQCGYNNNNNNNNHRSPHNNPD
jgi:hypothetical protein